MTLKNSTFFVLTIFVLLISCQLSLAQEVINKNNADKRTLAMYAKARNFSDELAFDKALKQLDLILKKEPGFVDAIMLKGAISYDKEDYSAAATFFEKAIELAPDYNKNIYYQLGVTYWQLKNYEACATKMEQFLKTNIKRQAVINRAKRYKSNALFAQEAIKNPVPFDPKPLGDNINTPDAMEILPITTADQFFLLYVKLINRQEDLYISQKVNGTWQKGQPLNGFSQPDINEGAHAISADGSTLVYTVCNRRGDYGSCDLYLADRIDKNRWTKPKNIGSAINSASWESQPALSANGKVLYFSSDRKGGYGKRDLWKTVRKEDGSWTRPENMGAVINTSENEEAPFLHPDEQTFYFMSDGHPGMGSSDLFLSRKDSVLQWAKPENLGYPINTEEKEGGIFITLDGSTAYFTKRTGLDNDIYTFDFPESKRPQAVTFVRANVINAETGERIIAEVELYDLNKRKLFNKIQTRSDGSFLTCLPLGTSYALSVQKKGFAFYSENFALEEDRKENEPYYLNIPLIPLKTITEVEEETDSLPTFSDPIVLKNIFFETGSAVLLAQSTTELNRLFALLNDNPDLKIQINGHTDDVGSEENNLRLSENRAKAVYAHLIEAGIDKARLSFKGYGEKIPVASNDSAEGRQQNRRTEFMIVN